MEVAGKSLTNMNLSVNPCEDFYQYSCGGWLKDLIVPPHKSKFSMFSDVEERNTGRLNQVQYIFLNIFFFYQA